MSAAYRQISALSDISPDYDVLLCDVWGVIHNGLRHHASAVAALRGARSEGIAVVLITNAPRPRRDVIAHLDSLGVARDAYDDIVTSGDVTRDLIVEGPRTVFHLGPDRDMGVYDGLDVELVDEFEARSVVCTGLFDDTTETPEDYADMLARFRSRDLPFICANPDIVVERGAALIWCAGALARDYGQLGGRTFIAGKPFAPIYARALSVAGALLGKEASALRALAIGDGILTDIKGAQTASIDALFISGGIHATEYGGHDAVDAGAMAEFFRRHGQSPSFVMPALA